MGMYGFPAAGQRRHGTAQPSSQASLITAISSTPPEHLNGGKGRIIAWSWPLRFQGEQENEKEGGRKTKQDHRTKKRGRLDCIVLL